MKKNIVLERRTFNLWSRQIRDITKDLLNEAVLEKFRAEYTTEDIYSDDSCWLADLITGINPGADGVSIEGELTRRLTKYYSAVRAFHAACPRGVSSYYEKGLLPLDPEAAGSAV